MRKFVQVVRSRFFGFVSCFLCACRVLQRPHHTLDCLSGFVVLDWETLESSHDLRNPWLSSVFHKIPAETSWRWCKKRLDIEAEWHQILVSGSKFHVERLSSCAFKLGPCWCFDMDSVVKYSNLFQLNSSATPPLSSPVFRFFSIIDLINILAQKICWKKTDTFTKKKHQWLLMASGANGAWNFWLMMAMGSAISSNPAIIASIPGARQPLDWVPNVFS